MNKEKTSSTAAAITATKDDAKVGELFTASSLEEYAEFNRDDGDYNSGKDEPKVVGK